MARTIPQQFPAGPRRVGAAAVILLTVTLAGKQSHGADAPGTNAPPSAAPTEWIDAATGHRLVRLSKEPGSLSLYFHQNPYTPQGDKLIIWSPSGLSAVDLKTRAVELIAPGVRYGKGTSATVEVGRKTRTVYYQKNVDGKTVIYAADIDTKASREVAKLGFTGEFGGVTSDETQIIGKCSAPGGADGGRKLQFFAVDIKTGAVRTFFPMSENLNHDQSSPTDPTLILYCHEGAWDQVDRIWTIRTDGTGARMMHKRTMPMEIAGHEFFGYDGETVWYDLQTPKSGVFWLASVNVQTGERIRYPVERSQWSVHYNQSHDGKLFAGDGGGPSSVANRSPDGKTFNPPANGQWIYLFTPGADKPGTMQVDGETVKVGKFGVEKLVDLSKHDYTLEPNLTFTPDNKWIVFRSNIEGPSQVYAVEVAKAK